MATTNELTPYGATDLFPHAHLVLKELLAPGLGQGFALQLRVLILSRDTRIADQHDISQRLNCDDRLCGRVYRSQRLTQNSDCGMQEQSGDDATDEDVRPTGRPQITAAGGEQHPDIRDQVVTRA